MEEEKMKYIGQREMGYKKKTINFVEHVDFRWLNQRLFSISSNAQKVVINICKYLIYIS